jgi:polyisoprenoid-binding protein YceI
MHRAITRLAFVIAIGTAAAPGQAVSAAPARSIALESTAAVWRIDPVRSEVRFTVTKLGFDDVTGVFRESEGQIRYDPADPSASVIQWRVRVASVLTDASNRDRTLQSVEYFDAARHPYLSFESRAITVRPDRSMDVAGDITIRGVTRRITVHVRPRASNDTIAFETDFVLDRYDYGVVGGTFFGRLIGRQVRVHLRVVGVAS